MVFSPSSIFPLITLLEFLNAQMNNNQASKLMAFWVHTLFYKEFISSWETKERKVRIEKEYPQMQLQYHSHWAQSD